PAGDARLDFVADHVTRDESAVLLVDRNRMRARPDDTHAAFQNVEQLWQLIEGCGANECADRCDTRVVALHLFVRRVSIFRHTHGAELVDNDLLAVEAIALLTKDD